MNRAAALCLAAVCSLTAGSAAHADSISYNFTQGSSPIFFNNGTLGAIRLMATSGAMPSTTGSISTSLVGFSFAPSSMPQNVSVPIDLTLSDSTGSKTIQVGTLSGQLWNNGSNLHFSGPSSVTTTFDGHLYTIRETSFQQVSGFGLSFGKLSFSVVDPPIGGGVGVPLISPEPSSLVLAGIGVPLLGVLFRRRAAKKINKKH